MSSETELPILPIEIFDKIKKSYFYMIESDDITLEEDLEILINLLFNYPERSFYFYQLKDGESNLLLNKAIDSNIILSEEWEFNFYRHPKYKSDFVKIEKKNGKYDWDWEQEAVELTPMFIRIKLKLSDMKRRQLETQEKIQIEKDSESLNPLLLKPSIWGVGIDLEKVPKLVKRIYKKIKSENN